MSLGTNSSSADENDYVNSACRKKKKTHLLKDMKWVNGVLAMGIVVTDWNTVHCHIALY